MDDIESITTNSSFSSESRIIISENDSLIFNDENSDYDFEDEYSITTEDDFDFERIFRQESIHFYQEKQDNNYYLGLCGKLNSRDNYYVIANTISIPSFLYNPYVTILLYLKIHNIIRNTEPNIDIIKLKILNNGTYSAVIKTSWLRIVQRRWKQIYRERLIILRNRKAISSIRYREIYGKYPYGLNNLPNLLSMRLLRCPVKS